MYVIVEIERQKRGTCRHGYVYRWPYMHVYLGKRWVFGLVCGERVTQGSSACFTRHTAPTILAKFPAMSLLLITRQREHHGTGHIIIHNDVIHFPRTPPVFPPLRSPYACPRSPSFCFSPFSSPCCDDTLSLSSASLFPSHRVSVSSILHQ